MRVAVKYWETYSKVFYVEAVNKEVAKQIVKDNVDDNPEIIEDAEMEDSGYKICTTDWHIKMPEEEWKKDLDFVGEEAEV